MAREVVHDDEVAWAQFPHEHLLDIGLEGIPVDGAVEHEGRDEALERQRANKSRRHPVAVGQSDPEPFASGTSAMASRHVGGSPSLVDEHEAVRVEIELALKPVPATSQDVGTILLRGMGGLFLRVMPWRAKKRWIVPKPKVRPCCERERRTSSMVASLAGPSAASTASW